VIGLLTYLFFVVDFYFFKNDGERAESNSVHLNNRLIIKVCIMTSPEDRNNIDFRIVFSIKCGKVQAKDSIQHRLVISMTTNIIGDLRLSQP
jgi:hypothetical protein